MSKRSNYIINNGVELKGPRFFIYGLRDPRNGKIRYVGKTTTGMYRPRKHKEPYLLARKTYKNNWLRQLFAEGLMYEILVLECADCPQVLNELERKWIAYGRQAGTLTNATEGGEGALGRKQTADARARIGAAAKAHGPTKGMLGQKHSEESRRKTSATLRALGRKTIHSAETRLKISIAATGRKPSPETCAKMSASHTGRSGYVSPEQRVKIRETLRAKYPVCTKCGGEWTLKQNGLKRTCLPCKNKSEKRWREAHPEATKKRYRDYKRKHAERIKAYKRRRYAMGLS